MEKRAKRDALAFAHEALQCTSEYVDTAAPESPRALWLRMAGRDISACPHCAAGAMHVVRAIAARRPPARASTTNPMASTATGGTDGRTVSRPRSHPLTALARKSASVIVVSASIAILPRGPDTPCAHSCLTTQHHRPLRDTGAHRIAQTYTSSINRVSPTGLVHHARARRIKLSLGSRLFQRCSRAANEKKTSEKRWRA